MRTRMNQCHRVDVDRLHGVLEGKLRGRGAGKTYAKVHKLAMQIAGGDYPSIQYGVNFLDYYKGYLLEIIRDVFPVYNLHIDWDKSSLMRLHVLREDGTEVKVFICTKGMNRTGLVRGPSVTIQHDWKY